jgi:hypothetical protein
MQNVYVLQHVSREGQSDEDVKLLGVYSSEVKANEALRTLSQQPGFCDNPKGFHIDAYELDKDHWEEGFDSQ